MPGVLAFPRRWSSSPPSHRASTGQFLTRDPKVGLTQDPYGYAGNDPANLTDPTGQCPMCILGFMAVGALSGGLTELGFQMAGNLIAGCPAFHDIAWGQVALAAGIGALTDGTLSFLGRGIRAAKTVDDILPTPQVGSTKLQNLVNNLYKGTTNPNRVGNGTTMDAIRNEIATGVPTGGRMHTIKGQETLNGLNNWLRRNKDADYYDRLVAQSLADELSLVLRGAP